jgi:hypothetical protein
MSAHVHAWALHDAVFELARGRGLRSFRVESKVTPAGETVITLVLYPKPRHTTPSAPKLK